MREKSIESKYVGEPGHGRVFEKNLAQGEVGRKVKRCIEACVDGAIEAGAHGSSGKRGRDSGVRIEDLPDGGKPRVQRVQLFVEAMPELPSHIGKCVEPDAVEACLLGPPDGILSEVLSDCGVL